MSNPKSGHHWITMYVRDAFKKKIILLDMIKRGEGLLANYQILINNQFGRDVTG